MAGRWQSREDALGEQQLGSGEESGAGKGSDVLFYTLLRATGIWLYGYMAM